MGQTDEVVVRDGRVLLGFMGLQEAQAFTASQSVGGWSRWEPEWKKTIAAVGARTPVPYTQPEIRDLSVEGAAAAAPVVASQLFQQQAAAHAATLKLVEIDRLLVFQQFVDAQFSLGTENNQAETDAEVIGRCFPLGASHQLGINIDATGAAYVTSLSRNVYVEPPQLVNGAQGQHLIAFPIVISPNWVGVAEVGGRYYLTNGYHRAWLLRHRGATHIPAMVSRFGSLNEAINGAGFFSHTLITSPGAPTFKDFFDEQLVATMPLKSTLTILQFRASRAVLSRLP
jgi:hypothetical protein